MRRTAFVLVAIASSCALPKLGIDNSQTMGEGAAAGEGDTAGSTSGGKGNDSGGASGSAGSHAQGGSVNGGMSSSAGSPDGDAGATLEGGAPSSSGSGGSSNTSGSGGMSGSGGKGGSDGSGGSSGSGGSGGSCPGSQKACPGGCTDTSKDANNCGQCGKQCPANAECSASSCGCKPGYLNCTDSCLADHSNEACGSCNKQCTGANECTTGDLCKVCSTGCAVLTTGAKNNSEFAAYTLPLSPHRNLNNTKLTMRLYGLDAADTYLVAYVVNSDDKASATTTGFDTGMGWYEITLLTTPDGGYDFSDVKQIDIAVGVSVDKTRATPSKIYVDRLDFAVGTSFDFTASTSPLVFSAGTFNVGNSNTTGTVTWLAPN